MKAVRDDLNFTLPVLYSVFFSGDWTFGNIELFSESLSVAKSLFGLLQ